MVVVRQIVGSPAASTTDRVRKQAGADRQHSSEACPDDQQAQRPGENRGGPISPDDDLGADEVRRVRALLRLQGDEFVLDLLDHELRVVDGRCAGRVLGDDVDDRSSIEVAVGRDRERALEALGLQRVDNLLAAGDAHQDVDHDREITEANVWVLELRRNVGPGRSGGRNGGGIEQHNGGAGPVRRRRDHHDSDEAEDGQQSQRSDKARVVSQDSQ